MMPDLELNAALSRSSESSDVDFKSGLDVHQPRDWLELIKDIVAFANSGGGHILVGLNDDGAPSGADVSNLLAVDPADIGNRLHKYTGQHLACFELVGCKKDGGPVCAIRVSGTRVPIVFSRVGEVELPDGKKKTAFALGTVYFRHGAKSEPGTTEDLRAFLERELEATRRSWLDGIAKVVEAPHGSRIAVLPPAESGTHPPISLTNDPSAPSVYAIPIDETHPLRQKDVVSEVNRRLDGRKRINGRDVICIRSVYAMQTKIEYCYTQKFASPRYSLAFVDWIASQFEANVDFFEETRRANENVKDEGVSP